MKNLHLTRETTVSSMAEVKGDNALFEGLLLQDSPRTAVRQPTDNVVELRVGEDQVKLGRESWLFRSVLSG